MSSSSSSFYSAPDSPPSVTSHQIHPHPDPPPTPRTPTPTPHPRANRDDDGTNPPSTPPSERWLSRVASSAGKVIAAVLGLAPDESDESEWDVISCYEEKCETGKGIEKPNADYAVEELKAVMPVMESEEELLNPEETLSREQIVIPVRPAQSRNVEVRSVSVAEAKEQLEKSKSGSLSFQPPLNINLDSCLSCRQNQEPFVDSVSPMNTMMFTLPYQNQRHHLSNFITPVKPTRLLDKFEEVGSQETLPREQSEKLINPAQSLIVESSSPFHHPPVQVHSVTEATKQFEENKTSSPSFELPVNSNTSVLPGNLDHCISCGQNQQPSEIMPSPSLSSRRLLPPSFCAPLSNPNSASSSLKQKQTHPLIPTPESQSNPCFKRKKTDFQCSLAYSNCKVPKKGASNLKAVIELFSGDFNAKFEDMDLLNVLEMKGIKFEDPSWWPK